MSFFFILNLLILSHFHAAAQSIVDLITFILILTIHCEMRKREFNISFNLSFLLQILHEPGTFQAQ